MPFWNRESNGLMNEEEFLASWSWDNGYVHPCYLKMFNSYRERTILRKAKLKVNQVFCIIWRKVAQYLWWFSLWMLGLLRINFKCQKTDEKKSPPAAPLDLNIWLDVADFLDPERRQSTLLLTCSQISDAIQQRIEQRVWHSEEEMFAAGDLLIKKNGFLLYRANLLKLVGRQNFISKCRLRLVEDVTDGNGKRGDAILLAVKYTPPAVIHNMCDNDQIPLADDDDINLPIIPERRMFEHRLLITSGKLMRRKFDSWSEQAAWRPRIRIGTGIGGNPYSCQIIGYTLMLKCFIQPQNQINRIVPAMGEEHEREVDDNIGLCKSKPSAICVEPKFWDFATFDFCREVYHCWPLSEGKCPIHFKKQFLLFPPYDQCDDRCEEAIKMYQKLEAKAMATATMPRPKALKWKKKLPHVKYGRDLDYAHRDYIERINGHMDIDQAAKLLHYEMLFPYFSWDRSFDVGVRPIKKGIQLIRRSPSNHSIANSPRPVRETQCFSRIVEFPMDVDENSIKCHKKSHCLMIVEAKLKE